MRNISHDTSPNFLLNTPRFSLTKCPVVLTDGWEIEEIRMMGSMVRPPVLAGPLQVLMVMWGRAGFIIDVCNSMQGRMEGWTSIPPFYRWDTRTQRGEVMRHFRINNTRLKCSLSDIWSLCSFSHLRKIQSETWKTVYVLVFTAPFQQQKGRW